MIAITHGIGPESRACGTNRASCPPATAAPALRSRPASARWYAGLVLSLRAKCRS